MTTSEDRERAFEERRLAHTAQIAMVNTLSSEGRSNSEIAQILGINESTVREVLKPGAEINWGYNCLTRGVHHGRPEALWNIALLHATNMFRVNELEELVVERIYTDAMMYVEAGIDPRPSREWAEKVKENAEALFLNVLKRKVGEITKYYDSPEWHCDVAGVITRLKEHKLNPHYQPLHGHDTINMLCRIIGTSASRTVS